MRSPESPNHSSGAASPRRASHVETPAPSGGDWIRTSDLPAPSRMRSQTAPRPEERVAGIEPGLFQLGRLTCKPLHHTRAQPSLSAMMGVPDTNICPGVSVVSTRAAMRTMWDREAARRLRVAQSAKGNAAAPLPRVPGRVSPRSLPRESREIHRAGASQQGPSGARAYGETDRVLQIKPMHGL